MKINTIDLFAGCGGLTEGFESTGYFNTLAAVEWEIKPLQTLRNRFKDVWENELVGVHFDIQRTDELFDGWSEDDKFGSHPGLTKLINNRKVDIVIGGPPCQAYSIAGRVQDANGMRDDYRNFLFEAFIKVLNRTKPKAFIFENVEGILSAAPGNISIISRIRDSFDKAGYEIVSDLRKYALLNANDFGVAQNRKRVIIIGLRRDDFKSEPGRLIQEFYTEMLPKHKGGHRPSVKDAIVDLPCFLPDLKEGFYKSQDSRELPNHIPRYHSFRDQRIFAELALDASSGGIKYPNAESLKELYFSVTGKESNFHKYHVLSWDKPSNTIPAHLNKDGLRHIHPDHKQARSITPREAARIQGFPDDFIFLGSQGDQYKMIGNAVPPPMANAIAMAMFDFLKKYS